MVLSVSLSSSSGEMEFHIPERELRIPKQGMKSLALYCPCTCQTCVMPVIHWQRCPDAASSRSAPEDVMKVLPAHETNETEPHTAKSVVSIISSPTIACPQATSNGAAYFRSLLDPSGRPMLSVRYHSVAAVKAHPSPSPSMLALLQDPKFV